MKKAAAILLSAVLLSIALCGCQSPLSRGLQKAEMMYGAEEVDLAKVYNDTEGYRHPFIRWNMTLPEIQDEFLASVSEVLGASEDGSITYEMSGMNMLLLGRRNDSTVTVFNGEGICNLVSVVFSRGDSEDEDVKGISLPDLFEQYQAKLIETFGEPERSEKTESTIENTKVTYQTSLWSYTTSEGLLTTLQWSAAYLSGSKEPSYLTLGFSSEPAAEE